MCCVLDHHRKRAAGIALDLIARIVDGIEVSDDEYACAVIEEIIWQHLHDDVQDVSEAARVLRKIALDFTSPEVDRLSCQFKLTRTRAQHRELLVRALLAKDASCDLAIFGIVRSA